jgi:hypothetical protein
MTAHSCAVAIVGDAQVIEFVQSAREHLILVAPAVNQSVAVAICEQAASLGEAAARRSQKRWASGRTACFQMRTSVSKRRTGAIEQGED